MSKNNHGKRMVPEYLIAKLETLEPGGDYTAGDNITIEDGVISATDTTYTAGPGIDITSDNLVRTKISIAGGLNYNNDGNMIVDNSVVAFKSDIVTSYNDLTDKPSIPTSATSNSTVTPSTIQLTFTYSDNTTETITVMTGASVTTTTTLS